MKVFVQTRSCSTGSGQEPAKTLFLLLSLMLVAEVHAQDFTYTNINGTITITGYRGSGGAVTIPSALNGLPVTSIGEGAFYGVRTINSVTIPNSVTGIGDQALLGCESLTNISLGSSVTNLGNNVFDGCVSLTNILVATLNPAYESADGVLFDKNEHMLFAYPPGKAGSYAIPTGVTNVGPYAFSSCTSLTNLTLPASMTRIGPDAFASFMGLSHIGIPDGVGTIGTNAFSGCFLLASAALGKGVTNIEDYAFGECTNLRAMYFRGNAPGIANDAFFGAYFTAYYLPGTTGWGTTFGGLPAVLWNPHVPTGDVSFGVLQNGFGFNIAGTPDVPLVVEACTNLGTQSWMALQNCTLTNGSIHFNDPHWTNFPARFYRIRSP